MTTDDLSGLIERLHDESERLSGSSLTNGCAGCGVAANVADQAATALSTLKDERDKLREALKPFVLAYDCARERYGKRYGNALEIGLKNFDAMPDDWSLEVSNFSMEVYRRARAALNEQAVSELTR